MAPSPPLPTLSPLTPPPSSHHPHPTAASSSSPCQTSDHLAHLTRPPTRLSGPLHRTPPTVDDDEGGTTTPPLLDRTDEASPSRVIQKSRNCCPGGSSSRSVAYAEPMTRHRLPQSNEAGLRVGFGLLCIGLIGLISGTLRVGSAPSWPSPWIWATAAGIVAFMAGRSILVSDWAYRGVTIIAAGAVAALRGLGYVVAPNDRLGFNEAAVGIYIAVVGIIVILWPLWNHKPQPVVPDPLEYLPTRPTPLSPTSTPPEDPAQ